jgi:heme-degrading monooxygenase HmoA
MHVIVWRFVPRPERTAEFEAAYGPQGAWAGLFAHGPGFVSVELLRDPGGAYLTLDRWENASDFEAFKTRYAIDYQRLDEQLEGLTLSEEAVGRFETAA